MKIERESVIRQGNISFNSPPDSIRNLVSFVNCFYLMCKLCLYSEDIESTCIINILAYRIRGKEKKADIKKN